MTKFSSFAAIVGALCLFSTSASAVPPICEKRWPDDFVMQKHCNDKQGLALIEIDGLVQKYSYSPTMKKIFALCHRRWIKSKATADYEMKLHCIGEQSKAAAELLEAQ